MVLHCHCRLNLLLWLNADAKCRRRKDFSKLRREEWSPVGTVFYVCNSVVCHISVLCW